MELTEIKGLLLQYILEMFIKTGIWKRREFAKKGRTII